MTVQHKMHNPEILAKHYPPPPHTNAHIVNTEGLVDLLGKRGGIFF